MDRHFRRPLPHRFIPFPSLESPFRVWSGNLKWNSPRCGAKGWERPAFSPTPTRDAMPSISIAEELAKKQREISVSEFFERNKQILGYDSATKALLTVVKEGVENALDATEEAEVLPDILVEVSKVDKDDFLVVIEDNGPGIVKKEVPNVFGRLLYGSRFHARRQSRGQQGLGISGAVMYGQLTTGKATKITSKVEEEDVAYQVELIVDTKKNMPNKVREDRVIYERAHGTSVEIPLRGRYAGGKQSIPEYLKATAIVNPHARITYKLPEGETVVLERASEDLPPKTKEIPPHPHGIELGTLMQMMKETKSYKLSAFLEEEFVRVSARVAKEICDSAGIDGDVKPKSLVLEEAKALHEAMQSAKLMAPPTDCLSPIGERLIKRGLKNVLDHVCSTKVPFTSEAKEAVATVDEIMTELDLALKECGRRLKTHLTKKAHRAKTKEKFEIVQLILPRIAEKSAKIVNKKVPTLDATITKIMGVVWIDEQIAYDKKTKRHSVTINVHNFTSAGKKLNLHLLMPRGLEAKSVEPKPTELRDDGKITWELKRIDSVTKASISFVLEGLDEAEYDESDVYVSGINPGLVIGAEPLPGDWELNYAEFEGEEGAAPEAAEEEGEIDYDETEESLEDE